MNHDLNLAATSLRKGQIHRLHHAAGQRIEALTGTLWITMDNDVRDIVIDAHDGFTIDAAGDTLVSAISDARFVVLGRA